MLNIQIENNIHEIHISCIELIVFPNTKQQLWFMLFVSLCVRLIFTVLEEGGVKMKLTVVDTPGFGDLINNDNWWVFQLQHH